MANETCVCDAFEAVVSANVRRGTRCDDAEASYPLELETGPDGVRLWLLRGDGVRVCLWPLREGA